MNRMSRLSRLRVAAAILGLTAVVGANLAMAAAAPATAVGALLAALSGALITAVIFSVWEWGFHRYLYHRDRGPALRPIFLTHHRDHHHDFYPP